jgi:hypothetical protein
MILLLHCHAVGSSLQTGCMDPHDKEQKKGKKREGIKEKGMTNLPPGQLLFNLFLLFNLIYCFS